MLALSWSGGKDSALALEALRESGREPDLLLSTIDGTREVVPHHDVPVSLLRQQAASLGLPLVEVEIPPEATNDSYEARMRQAFEGPMSEVTEVAFGDLFLEDLRACRESRLDEVGRRAIFPIWGHETTELAFGFSQHFDATVCSVDRTLVPGIGPGVPYDQTFLASLPSDADPCGENGEFHTFVHDGPGFRRPVGFELSGIVESGDGRYAHALIGPSLA